MTTKQIIMGVDPGTRITGYGIIECHGQKMKVIDFGTIRPRGDSSAMIYRQIFEGVTEVLKNFQPGALAVELQYLDKNVSSALKLGMARGVAVLAAAMQDIPVFEYAPTKAKKAVVGKGSASKAQVQNMIKALLGLVSLPEPEDAADALALAICHAHTRRSFPCTNSSAAH